MKKIPKTRMIVGVASKLNPNHASIDWLAHIELGSRAYLEINPERLGNKYLELAIELSQQAQKAVLIGHAECAAISSMAALQAIWQAEIAEGRSIIKQGILMTDGRKPNTSGPIRKKIASLLKKNPAMKNPQLLKAIAENPPRGWTYYENPFGKYFEGPVPKQEMKEDRFFNVCGEERKKIKQ